MNTDSQAFYPNQTVSHQAPNGLYQPNGMNTHFIPRNPNSYGQPRRMNVPFYNHPGYTNYPQQPPVFIPSYPQPSPFAHSNDPQAVNPFIRVVRPLNEVPNGAPSFVPTDAYIAYASNNLHQQSTAFPTPLFRPQYMSPNGSQHTPSTQIPLTQYTFADNQQQTQASINQPYGVSSQSAQSQEKRKKTPLAITDPHSQKPLELEASTLSTSAAPFESNYNNRQQEPVRSVTITNSQIPNERNGAQTQMKYRTDFAQLLKSNPQTDKPASQSSTNGSTNTRKEATANKSSGQPQQCYPGIRTRSVNNDDRVHMPTNHDNKSNYQRDQPHSELLSDDEIQFTEEPLSHPSIANIRSKPTSTSATTEPLECVTPTLSNDTESESVNSEQTPSNDNEFELVNIEQTPPNETEFESVNIEQTPPNETDSEAIKVEQTSANDAETESMTSEQPPSKSKRFSYTIEELRSKRLAMIAQKRPAGLKYVREIEVEKQKLVDANNKFLRDVRLILNQLTPQTYDKLLHKLEELELDRYERLDGMIMIIFSKAVEEPKFCFMYANLCKYFQKKQVTMPDADGKAVTHYFRQILLARCQKSFETDYREEIGYDKRKSEVEAIEDEKMRKEEEENLAEALFKAKRRNFGNILFIGELFKLGMLTDTIMYDCMDYLLQNKADEEDLECLCRLLRTIGQELEAKASHKSPNRKILEKNYSELNEIIHQQQTSVRTRFMIQDLMDLRKANWVARIAEAKPVTIDEIHEQARIKREQDEFEQERDRQQRREQHRGNNNYGGNHPQQYTGSRGSRGSGMKQQNNRTNDERNDKPFNVSSLKQFQSSDKRAPGSIPMSFAPQNAWPKVSATEKKNEDVQANATRSIKSPTASISRFAPQTSTAFAYATKRPPPRELIRANSPRDREEQMEPLRKTASVDSAVSSGNETFDEEKTQSRVKALIEEYTENYSENNNRAVTEAVEDLSSFCTANINQQAMVVRELFTNVLETKTRARKAIGHLLDQAFEKKIISHEGFSSGLKMIVEVVPDYAVDIPFIWQYIGEILGAFIGASSSNMLLLKSILQSVPEDKSKQLFQYIIRYATEFSSRSHVQTYWQSAGLSLNHLFNSEAIDSSFTTEYNWLSEPTETTRPKSETSLPHADPQLVTLFKSTNDQDPTITDAEILTYINENMNPEDKFYIRNIVLSYLEACLVDCGEQKKIQEEILKERMTILNEIVEHKPEAELQVVYAIQNFVTNLEHPPEMAHILFEMFSDDECVSEETFFEWHKQTDQSETDGHSMVVISTADFFKCLQADGEDDGSKQEEN